MRKKEKRQARKKINKKEIDFFKPLNITDFGTEKDPCFGKLYDVKANECSRCGDSEICLIVMSQRMNTTRKKLEKENSYLDTEDILPDEKDEQLAVPNLIKRYVSKNYTLKKTRRLILKKFPNTNTDKIKRLYTQYGK